MRHWARFLLICSLLGCSFCRATVIGLPESHEKAEQERHDRPEHDHTERDGPAARVRREISTQDMIANGHFTFPPQVPRYFEDEMEVSPAGETEEEESAELDAAQKPEFDAVKRTVQHKQKEVEKGFLLEDLISRRVRRV